MPEGYKGDPEMEESMNEQKLEAFMKGFKDGATGAVEINQSYYGAPDDLANLFGLGFQRGEHAAQDARQFAEWWTKTEEA
jgi:hypothetical protein